MGTCVLCWPRPEKRAGRAAHCETEPSKTSSRGRNKNCCTSCHCPSRKHLKKGSSPGSGMTSNAARLAALDQCCCQSGTSMTARARCSLTRASTRGMSRSGGKAQFQPDSCRQSWVMALGGRRAPGSSRSDQKRVSRAFARHANRSQDSEMPRSANACTTHLQRCGVNCHSNRSASESAFGGEGRLRPSTPTRTISTPEMWQISERLVLYRMKKPQSTLVR